MTGMIAETESSGGFATLVGDRHVKLADFGDSPTSTS